MPTFTNESLGERLAAHDHWAWAVRDVAQKNSEGVRAITFGKAVIEYEIAPMPDGRFALTYDFRDHVRGHGTSWDVYESRKDCIDTLLTQARKFFGNGNWPGMLEQLRTDTLFGFSEPDVDPERTRFQEMIMATVKAHLHSPS